MTRHNDKHNVDHNNNDDDDAHDDDYLMRLLPVNRRIAFRDAVLWLVQLIVFLVQLASCLVQLLCYFWFLGNNSDDQSSQMPQWTMTTQLAESTVTFLDVILHKHSSTSSDVSYNVRVIFQWICFAIVCELVDIFGTVTNIINIICFVKQGFRDPVTVSLLGLAISDLGCLVTLIWTNVCFNPLLNEADVSFESIEVQYLTSGWPHVMFTRVTAGITAFITFERCLCITMPLKVKSIITPKRVTVIIVSIFIVLIASVSPVYYANRLQMKFSPERNKTIFGLVYMHDREQVEKASFAINNVFVPMAAFIVVIICTVTLAVKLRSKTKWRQNVTASGISENSSNRDQRVTKMVVVISCLFISCFIPVCFIFIGMLLEPGLAIDGKYRNMFFIVFGLGFLLESTNSATNIFIYYYMSSRYRSVFRQIFVLRN